MLRNSAHLRTVLAATAATPVVMLTFASSPASADAPTVVEQHVVRQLSPGECNGHLIVADFDFVRTLTTFYSDGVPVRQVIHAQISGTTRDTVTGVSLPTFGVRVIFLTGTGQFIRSTGTNTHIVVPGVGTVQIAAGNDGIDDEGNFFAHGREYGPLTEALCEALAR
jgi:hypothetical protein